MWVVDLIAPFSDVKPIDVSEHMRHEDRSFINMRMYKTAEYFYLSIGMDHMTSMFWNRSIFEKPESREDVCHASSYDFLESDDYR